MYRVFLNLNILKILLFLLFLKEAAPTESLLNWQDYEGRTPLHFAVADGNVAVVDVLTSYEGCNVTSYDNLFRTPLHWAALLGKLDSAEVT